MDLVLSRILSSLCLVLSASIGLSIPVIMTKFSKKDVSDQRRTAGQGLICICNCVAAGVIMAMSFLHIFPESVHLCSHAGLFIKIKENSLNLCFPIMLLSFSLMLFSERVISFGRSPCSSQFNDCNVNTHICESLDEESLVHKDLKTIESQEIIQSDKRTSPRGIRYKHRHSKILSTIKNILCPICDCTGLCITLALFVHSVFEGMVVGLENNEFHMWLITIGIVLHKWAAAMALSTFIMGNTKITMVLMFTIFSIGSPLGVLIGSIILDTNSIAIAVINSLALGTLTYVGFEILVHELFTEIKCKRIALYKWFSFMGGLSFIFGTIMLEFYLSEHAH